MRPSRRSFLSFCGLSVAGFALNPGRLLWTPPPMLCGYPIVPVPWAHLPSVDEGGFLVPPRFIRAVFETADGQRVIDVSERAGGMLGDLKVGDWTSLEFNDDPPVEGQVIAVADVEALDQPVVEYIRTGRIT